MNDLDIPGIDDPVPLSLHRAAHLYGSLPRAEKLRRLLVSMAIVLRHHKHRGDREACIRLVYQRRATLRELWAQEAADEAARRQVAATGELGRIIMGEV